MAIEHKLSANQIKELAMFKFGLMSTGMQVAESALPQLSNYKRHIRTRSGTSGGLDIKLPHDIYVNVPITEKFAKESRFELNHNNEKFEILCDGEFFSQVELLPKPKYYDSKTTDGNEYMIRIGQMCSPDRFCFGMTGPSCYFWEKSKRCKFCSIGDNYNSDAPKKNSSHLLEVLESAIYDPLIPAKHILLGGGTPKGDDMGAILASELCTLIKSRFEISIYVMISAPLKNSYIDMLYDAGADELGMNLEFWSEAAWKKFIPGKYNEIGKKRYLDALDFAVKKFGPINTRTILVAGLEEKRYTIEGAVTVASMGVMPIISPFRPLTDTMLEHEQGFDAETYYEIYEAIQRKIQQLNIPIGPTCICCQNNTLALPFGYNYRFY